MHQKYSTMKKILWLLGLLLGLIALGMVYGMRMEVLSAPENYDLTRDAAIIEVSVEFLLYLVFHGQFIRICCLMEEPLSLRDCWFRRGESAGAIVGKLIGWMIVFFCVRFLLRHGDSFFCVTFSLLIIALALYYMILWAAERRWKQHHW